MQDMFSVFEIPPWCLCVFVSVLVLHLYTSRQHGLFRALNIDGPKPYPFIGGLPEMLRKGMIQNNWDNVRKYGKCFGAFMGNLPTFMVTDTEIIKHVFIKDFHHFRFRGQAFNVAKFWRNGLNLAEGDHWKFLRETLSPSFSTGKIRNMTSVMNQCIDTMTSVIEEKLAATDELIDMTSVFHSLALDMTCGTILGVTVNSQEEPDNELVKNCKKLFEISLETSPCVAITCLFPHMKHVFDFFDIDFIDKGSTRYLQTVVTRIIADRKASPDDNRADLLALMIQMNARQTNAPNRNSENLSYADYRSRGMSDVEMTANAVAFMLGGYDTTSATLMFASYLLAVNPQCQQSAVDEIEKSLADGMKRDSAISTYDLNLPYIDAIVSETMRLYPVGTMTNRESDRDMTVCGINIPKGIPVTVPIYVLHRMPEYWNHPNDFIPERWLPENKQDINPYAYMPFGLGPRGCIAKRMALVAIKLVLVRLLREFKLEPAPDLHVPLRLKNTFFLCPKDPLRLKISKRN